MIFPANGHDRVRRLCSIIAGLLLTLAGCTQINAPSTATTPFTSAGDERVINKVKGHFEVKMVPMTAEPEVGDASVGRMNLQKTFHGDLNATGKGQMLTMMTDVKGSAGYVAMERVTGTLQGRSGSFALQHSGTMTRGEPSLEIRIVPDSGTDQLTGITGRLLIDIVEGKHFYTLEYSLP